MENISHMLMKIFHKMFDFRSKIFRYEKYPPVREGSESRQGTPSGDLHHLTLTWKLGQAEITDILPASDRPVQ